MPSLLLMLAHHDCGDVSGLYRVHSIKSVLCPVSVGVAVRDVQLSAGGRCCVTVSHIHVIFVTVHRAQSSEDLRQP